jgi:hypothetical protein
MSYDEVTERRIQIYKELRDEYYAQVNAVREFPTKKIQLGSKYVTKEAAERQRLSNEHLTQQHAQIELARSVTRISPVTIVQHLLESFAGTGFERHLQFLENVQSYAQQFLTFIVDTDQADPESLHIYGIRKGMSQKPVSPKAIPKFEDTLDLSKDLNTAATELALLTLFVVVLLSGAYLAFVRVEV